MKYRKIIMSGISDRYCVEDAWWYTISHLVNNSTPEEFKKAVEGSVYSATPVQKSMDAARKLGIETYVDTFKGNYFELAKVLEGVAERHPVSKICFPATDAITVSEGIKQFALRILYALVDDLLVDSLLRLKTLFEQNASESELTDIDTVNTWSSSEWALYNRRIHSHLTSEMVVRAVPIPKNRSTVEGELVVRIWSFTPKGIEYVIHFHNLEDDGYYDGFYSFNEKEIDEKFKERLKVLLQR